MQAGGVLRVNAANQEGHTAEILGLRGTGGCYKASATAVASRPTSRCVANKVDCCLSVNFFIALVVAVGDRDS